MRINHGCFKVLFNCLAAYEAQPYFCARTERRRLVCLTKALIMQDRLS